MLKQFLDDIPVTHCVDSRNSNLIEIRLRPHLHTLEFVVPVNEVALVELDHVLKHSSRGWEDRCFELTQNIVDLLAARLIDSRTH